MRIPGCAVVIGLACCLSVAHAHNNEKHVNDGVETSTDTTSNQDLPIDVGGAFELEDHDGNPVSNRDFSGKHMLVFFGCTQCKNMCSLSLTRIGGALALLGDESENLSALMITVDPEQDTPQVLATELKKYHSSLIGLTGTPEQLAKAYKAYKQKPAQLEKDWQGDAVVSHQSYIYLMDRMGKLQTFFPPILNSESMARIMRKYIKSTG